MDKKSSIPLCCVLLLTIIFWGRNGFAGGFYLPEVASPGSVGTSSVANVVNTWGADSVYTNPAGMTGLQRDSILVGTQALLPNMKFDSSIAEAGGDDGGNAGVAAVVPGAYFVKAFGEDFRSGFSFAAPLGGGVDYRSNFVGRYQAIKSSIQGVAISPAVAYRVNNRLSLGAGLSAIYTLFNEDIAVNQPGVLADGKVKFEDLDDWSPQGFFGMTFHLTDNIMLGAVYRTQSEPELEGDIDFKNIQVPIENRVTSRLDKMEIDFDLPQVISVGLDIEATDRLKFFADFDWEDWSEFSKNKISIEGGDTAIITTIDRNWKDTWHVGVGMQYDIGDAHRLMAGASCDSSVVDNEDRTADLPLDAQTKISFGFGTRGNVNLKYGIAATLMYMGDGKIDQTAQGARFKGEFDTNYMVIVGGMLQYQF